MTVPSKIGRYEILGLLGKGAMGTVYRGRDDALDREAAVKVISVGQADDDARTRFLREGKASARLQHPNIVTIYELGEHEGQPFMALELLEGLDLQRAIEGGIRPYPRITLPIVLQLLAGLGHAHEHGIVHRDVKPSNLFLPRGRPAKIMDFGVARLAGGQTSTGMVVGTPNYMSPEQARGGSLDGRSDLFSAGLILYELVTGEKAYQSESVISLLFKIVHEEPDFGLLSKEPSWERLQGVLHRSLAKNPADRYPDARAMATDLEAALRDLGGSFDVTAGADQALMGALTPRPTAIPTAFKAPTSPAPGPAPTVMAVPAAVVAAPPAAAPASRQTLLLGAGIGALVVIVLALGAALWLRREPSPSAPGAAASTGPAPSVVAGTPSPAPSPPKSSPPTAAARPSPSSPPTAVAMPSAVPTLAATAAAPSPSARPLEAEAPVPPASSPAEARLDRANDLMEKGRYGQALAEAKAILLRDPKNAQAKALAGDAEAAIVVEDCVTKARAALKAGDNETALVEVRRGMAVNKSDARLLALFREATQ